MNSDAQLAGMYISGRRGEYCCRMLLPYTDYTKHIIEMLEGTCDSRVLQSRVNIFFKTPPENGYSTSGLTKNLDDYKGVRYFPKPANELIVMLTKNPGDYTVTKEIKSAYKTEQILVCYPEAMDEGILLECDEM